MLDLKPTHKSIDEYYNSLMDFSTKGVVKETTVREVFIQLLQDCAKKTGCLFEAEYPFKPEGSRTTLHIDGAVTSSDKYKLPLGYWEAKDIHDDLAKEITKKFDRGYPKDNIIFWTPERIILYQNSDIICDEIIATSRENLVRVLNTFFNFRSESQLSWEGAVEKFKSEIPDAAKDIIKLIETERKENQQFIDSFSKFAALCRSSINRNISDVAIEEMLVQHLLTERIFSTLFNRDFVRKNVIAREIENVIDALTSRKLHGREEFFRRLDHFYIALENRTKDFASYQQKQSFLNSVYEKFFQGFAVRVADVYGIVYTPQPIVDFMVRSVEEILKQVFSKSLNDPDVVIIDPFVGTGSFITRIMQEIKTTSLEDKYSNGLYFNDIMLLPYYISCLNVEHEYNERIKNYKPFLGACLVDTFDLAEEKQPGLAFAEENTQRIEKLKTTKLFVIISNPPYNANQVNENDNNKNKRNPAVQERVHNTYSHDSVARNKNKLGDPYVKAIRWASDKIIENGEGILAFVTNNSFVEHLSFDGMRKNLLQDFNQIYIIDLGGNVKKNPKLSGTVHNVFGIQVGVSINLFVKKKESHDSAKLYYLRTDKDWKKEDKFHFLNTGTSVYGLEYTELTPDENHNWLTEGLETDFNSLLCLSSRKNNRETKGVVFSLSCLGINTNRDAWAYNCDCTSLANNIKKSIGAYNEHLFRRPPPNSLQELKKTNVDKFVDNEDTRIGWSEGLKWSLIRDKLEPVLFESNKIRRATYRPFVNLYLYFDKRFTERRYQMPRIFPTVQAESENQVICVSGRGHTKPFQCFITNLITSCDLLEKTQCFPFYIYNEDDSGRRENITDWALEEFRKSAGPEITKWDIFYYVYGLLHCQDYRDKYATNLKIELPRIPLPTDQDNFRLLSNGGKKLAELHLRYEEQPEYKLEKIQTSGKLDWAVNNKMKLSKDKTAIIYNDSLKLSGIPPEVFNYKLGNKSALEWIIDRCQKTIDKRSRIENNPNRTDDPQYIVKLIGKIITVSLETMKIVSELKMPQTTES